MYREMLPVDLPTVSAIAVAQNLDIQQAKERVEAQRGRYESSVGRLFPVIAPTIAFQHVDGVNQAVNGTLVPVDFSTVIPAITLQWIVNPGQVIYDIVASKKRLQASAEQEEATQLDTLRAAGVQYYDLILAQAKVAVARQAVQEADESLRLTSLRIHAGTGLAADEMRARADQARRQQDLLIAVNSFYEASVSLTLTLHLDSTVTLVPAAQQIEQTALVRDDLAIEQLLALAVEHRPDLKSVRTLLAASKSDSDSIGWSAFGPQVQASYSYGGLNSRASGVSSGMQEQKKGAAGAGFALGASSFGQTKTAKANFRSAGIDVDRQLDRVRAQVISAQQSSITAAQLVPTARSQLQSAEEALRLAQANLKSGTVLLLDVLQSQNQLDDARLRHADAVVKYNQSQINLLAAVGLLEAHNLFPPSTQPSVAPGAD